MKPLYWMALSLLTTPAQAATVYRCVDDAGQVRFSQLGCPAGQATDLQIADNPSPSSHGSVRLAAPDATRKPVEKSTLEVTVVGETDDGCGNQLSSRERRTAILRNQVRPGMTLADVESALGKPDRISGTNAKLRYHYEADPKRVVTFDERGCVPRK